MNATTQASDALKLLKSAILDYVANHPNGVGNSEIARDLGLESDFQGKQKNYLSWSVIGLLVNEGSLDLEKQGRNVLYKVAGSVDDMNLKEIKLPKPTAYSLDGPGADWILAPTLALPGYGLYEALGEDCWDELTALYAKALIKANYKAKIQVWWQIMPIPAIDAMALWTRFIGCKGFGKIAEVILGAIGPSCREMVRAEDDHIEPPFNQVFPWLSWENGVVTRMFGKDIKRPVMTGEGILLTTETDGMIKVQKQKLKKLDNVEIAAVKWLR